MVQAATAAPRLGAHGAARTLCGPLSEPEPRHGGRGGHLVVVYAAQVRVHPHVRRPLERRPHRLQRAGAGAQRGRGRAGRGDVGARAEGTWLRGRRGTEIGGRRLRT